jgi:putative membrane protein
MIRTVGLLSIMPTVRIIGWGKQANADAGYAVSLTQARALRPWLLAEAALFVLIPVFAAMMARGY